MSPQDLLLLPPVWMQKAMESNKDLGKEVAQLVTSAGAAVGLAGTPRASLGSRGSRQSVGSRGSQTSRARMTSTPRSVRQGALDDLSKAASGSRCALALPLCSSWFVFVLVCTFRLELIVFVACVQATAVAAAGALRDRGRELRFRLTQALKPNNGRLSVVRKRT